MSIGQTASDDVFEVLSDRRRRRLLLALRTERDRVDPEKDIDALTEVVASGGDADQVRVQLRHVHLPKLADGGYIRWNTAADTITTGPRWASIASVLDVLLENRDRLPAGTI